MTDTKTEVNVIAVAATFTAEPVEESLAFWARELGERQERSFAPYNQVFQTLLDPAGPFHVDRLGANVVLVRIEDWLRDTSGDVVARRRLLDRNAQDLVRAVQASAARTTRPHIFISCPPSPSAAADGELGPLLLRSEEVIVSSLAHLAGVHVVRAAEMLATYPLTNHHDAHSDEVGHIPLTREGFAVLGTMISRRLFALRHPPCKVIVVDCDWTLWHGVCAEDGLSGVRVTPAYRDVQERLLGQQRAGALLCLASKNREEDVLEVFDRHPDMILRREHIVAHRINWNPKSESLVSLAQELGLGLDSFVFLDDNPVECTEVRARCPEVLVLEVPSEGKGAARLLDLTWAFDRLRATDEDRIRTELYRQTIKRTSARRDFMTVGEFLRSLELKVDVHEVSEGEVVRVVQLTQRTNQFNATTIRRSEGEIRALLHAKDVLCRVVEVRDRFGDYGMVGVLIARTMGCALSVDTFLVSCRALGRGVEHHMLAELGRLALERGLNVVRIPFVETRKNQPMRQFLDSVAAATGDDLVYELPAALAAEITYEPDANAANSVGDDKDADAAVPVVSRQGKVRDSHEVQVLAARLTDVGQLIRAIVAGGRRRRPDRRPYVAPQTKTEEMLADIWTDVLGLDQVGGEDDFFELGGSSLQGTALLSKVREAFGVDLSLVDLFDARTLSAYGRRISLAQIDLAGADDLSTLIEEIGELSDAEVAALLAADGHRFSDPSDRSNESAMS